MPTSSPKNKTFRTLDFHVSTRYGEEPQPLGRNFRVRIFHILDSINARIPKSQKTKLFSKLNVRAEYQARQPHCFGVHEGVACVDLLVPDIATIYRASQAQAVKRVKQLLRKGIKLAADHDPLFAKNLPLWLELIATSGRKFEYDLGIARSHPSRRWHCEAVLGIAPDKYRYDLLVKDSRTLKIIERHRIKTTECVLPIFTGVGFSKLRWDKQDIIGLDKTGAEVFRFKTKLPPN